MLILVICCILGQGSAGHKSDLYQNALNAYSRDDLPAAESFLQQALKAGDRSFRVHYLLGAALVRMDRGDQAIPELEAAHRVRPREADVTKLLAIQYMNGRRQNDSLHLLQQVPDADRDEELDLLLIEANQDSGSVDDTARLVERAAKRYPNSARINAWMGFEMRESARFKEAQTFLRKALKEDPSLPAPYFLMGDVLLRTERYGEALPWLRKAIELTPNDAEANVALSRALIGLGELQQAQDCLERASREFPEDVRIALELARLYSRAGNRDKARAQAQIAARLRAVSRTVPELLLYRR